MVRVLLGLIADTHGHLGADVIAALQGCDRIIHAGDVGAGVLAPLRRLAPLTAVRGNNDTSGEAADLPELVWLVLAGVRIAVVHRLADAPADGWEVLVFGHCHRRHADSVEGRLSVNPGAAGRRGFHSARSVAHLSLAAAVPSVTFVDLGPRAAMPRPLVRIAGAR